MAVTYTTRDEDGNVYTESRPDHAQPEYRVATIFRGKGQKATKTRVRWHATVEEAQAELAKTADKWSVAEIAPVTAE